MPAELQRVLLVEDDLDIQAVALIALEDVGGLTVRACGSGPEALGAAPEFMADLVLLDVMMPGMTGPDTLRALRERPETRDVPVVFMTARVQRHEVDEYLAMGAVGVIPKPFEPMTLADELRRLYGAAREAQEEREERDFEAQIAALRGQFEHGLPERVARLREAWAAARRGEGAGDVRQHAHALVGTGRTLGRTTLGDLARELEVLADGADEALARPEQARRVEELLDAIEAEATRGAP